MPKKMDKTPINLTLYGAPITEVSVEFLQGMVDGMGNSFFKYGAVAEGYPNNVDAIASLEVRLQRYKDTGNLRWLRDIGNFAMIESMHPRHPQAHVPEDDAPSPGRVDNSGNVSEHANNAHREAIRKPDTAPSWMRHSGD